MGAGSWDRCQSRGNSGKAARSKQMRCVGTRRPGHPVPAQGSRPHPLQGRATPGGPLHSAGFLPGLRSAGSHVCEHRPLWRRPRARVCLYTPGRALTQAPNLALKCGGEAAGPSLGPLGPRLVGLCLGPSPSADRFRLRAAGPVSVAGWTRLFSPCALRPGFAVQQLPSRPLEMPLETLSGAPRPPRPHRHQPGGGGRGGSWETRAGSPGTLAAPPGASARPARPPRPGPQRPRGAPRRRPLARPGCGPEPPPSPPPAHSPDWREAARRLLAPLQSFLPAHAWPRPSLFLLGRPASRRPS